MITDKGSATPRGMRIAALVAVPAVMAALYLGLIGTLRLVRPQSALFVAPAEASLAEAIRQRDTEGAFAFIRAGQSPNGPIVVQHERLTGGRALRVSPLLWAVAVRNDSAVRMLLGFGARAERSPDVMAACLAERVGDAGTAEFLRRTVPATAAQPCQTPPADDGAVLLPFASD